MSEPAAPPPLAPAQGAIHDLGYAPYTGPRTPPSRRFWVIAENEVAVAWRQKWAVKVPLFFTAAFTLVALVSMYLLRNELAEVMRHGGVPLPRPDEIIFTMVILVYSFLGFLLAMAVACPSIADDLRLGAFQFYFSRPIRPRDYVFGKLLGLFAIVGLPLFAGPVLLALFRVLLSGSLEQAVAAAGVVLRAVALGLLATAAVLLPAVATGALARRRAMAQALYAVYYLLVGGIATSLSSTLDFPWVRLIATNADLATLGRALFGIVPEPHDPPAWAAAAAIGVIGGACAYLVMSRVKRAETAGLGGGG
jgi:ABC-2 type transport system permease protein